MPIPVSVKGEHIRVSLLLWRAYGQAGVTTAMLTATYRLNPGLASLPTVLPLGTKLTLPDLETKKSVAARVGVDLFGAS